MLMLLTALPLRAQIKTDGSVGARQTLSGPAYAIPATLGRQVGSNLFHSFSDLNIQSGESATFSGPGSVQNVLSRVTGGSASTINGTLRCDIPGANLYLMNPSGVVFGPGATLDVSGSFAVTSADYLRLGKSGRFNAAVATGEVLSSAPPTAFGFLARRTGSIDVTGGQLAVDTAKTLSVVANGDIRLTSSAVLTAPAGRVNLVAAGSAGQIGLRAGDLESPVDSSLTAYGNITATAGASVDTSGDFGGPIMVRANNFALDNSGITSFTAGAVAGRTVDIQLTGDLTFTGGAGIKVDTAGAAPGGQIAITAADLSVSQGATIEANTVGDGAAGDIRLRVGTLAVTQGGNIAANTSGRGPGGVIDVNATQSIFIRGDATGLQAVALGQGAGAGSAGDVNVSTPALGMRDGGYILSGTTGGGNGGRVSVVAGTISLRRGALIGNSAIAGSTGNGGNISIRAGSLIVADGSLVSATVLGDGNGGSLDIRADHLLIQGNQTDNTGLYAASVGETTPGSAGDITIHRSGSVTLENGGTISVATEGTGPGGSLKLDAHSLTVDGADTLILAATFAPVGGGPGGTLRISTDRLVVRNSGKIAGGTFGSGAGGAARIVAGHIRLTGVPTDTTNDSTTGIFAGTSGSGPGGELTVRAGLIRLENGAGINVGTNASGNGGSATVLAREIALDRGAVIAGSQRIDAFSPPATGIAGTVIIHATKVMSLQNGSVIGAKAEVADAGNITLQAPRLTLRDSSISGQASQTGGSINISAHDLLYLFRSRISAVGQQQLGNVTIDPIFTVLDQSSIMTTSDIAGGNINVRTDRFFKSRDSVITAAQNATVTLTIYTPNADITGSLVPVDAPLIDSSASFIEECSRRLQVDLSSFLITGRGGQPVQPGGLDPAFDLRGRASPSDPR
jgi:filamentous hemagglutinin family protein